MQNVKRSYMKIFGKEKASPKSNPKGTGPELSEIVALMTKIVERLEVLEKKTDLVISQTSSRSFARRESPKAAPQPTVLSQPFRQSNPPAYPNELKPVQDHSRGRAQGRREKILHKAVCADCHKDCEIPFKPTGERPVYCKECFSKRKSSNPVKVNDRSGQTPDSLEAEEPLNSPERQVIVTKKGVGRVTVSEIVQPSARAASQKKKDLAPEKKSKR